MDIPIIFWILFNAFILLKLALDLGIFHRRTHEVSLKEALTWTFVWDSLAILRLRSLYFALAGIVHRFWLLSYGLAVVLVFVGTKMLLIDVFKILTEWSLVFIATPITGSIMLSLRIQKS